MSCSCGYCYLYLNSHNNSRNQMTFTSSVHERIEHLAICMKPLVGLVTAELGSKKVFSNPVWLITGIAFAILTTEAHGML